MTDREKEVLNTTINIIKDNLSPKKIIMFGSRAKGKSKFYADFDLDIEMKKRYADGQKQFNSHL